MMRTCGDPETETTSSARCDWSEDDENHGNHISQQVAYFTYRHIIYCLAPFFKVNSTVATILVSRWLISHTDILYIVCTIFQGEFNHGNHISQQVAYFTYRHYHI